MQFSDHNYVELSWSCIYYAETDLFSFTCLLHTYFSLPDVTKSTVSGLGGLTYIDKVAASTASLDLSNSYSIPQFYNNHF